MKKMAALFLILGLVALNLLAGRTAYADDDLVDRAGQGIKKGGEAAGRGIKNGGEAAARGIDKGVKVVEPAIKKGGKAAVKGIKTGGDWVSRKLKKSDEKSEKAGN